MSKMGESLYDEIYTLMRALSRGTSARELFIIGNGLLCRLQKAIIVMSY